MTELRRKYGIHLCPYILAANQSHTTQIVRPISQKAMADPYAAAPLKLFELLLWCESSLVCRL